MAPRNISSAFEHLCDQLAATQDPWWIIGGAAMHLLGLDKEAPRDIDVIVSEADSRTLHSAWGLPNLANQESELFRSSWMVRLTFDSVPIEVFAGFQIRQGVDWHNILPITQQEISFASRKLYTPQNCELIDIFELCGRPKDLKRAQLLRGSVSK